MALSYYEVLGVEPGVDDEALKRGYKLRAQLLHPDRHAGAAPEVVAAAGRAMVDLNRAWAVLREPASRRLYDVSIGVPPQPVERRVMPLKIWLPDVAPPASQFIAHA